MISAAQSPARRVAVAGVVGALYVVLSLLVAPFAFGPVQFRIGEALKPLVIRYPATIFAFGAGTVLVNIFSPFAGTLELLFMPIVDMAGGVVCWLIARRVPGAVGTYLASFVYAVVTAAGVGVVLSVVAGLPYLLAFATVVVSEVILLLVGNAVLVERVWKRGR
ncbi:MAG: QueT transporter family protein [Rubrobacteraceae bacterium]